MNIGFIGAGNMAGAIIRGLSAAGRAGELCFFDVDGSKARALSEETGAKALSSSGEVIENSAYLVLAIKPNMYKKVLKAEGEKIRRIKPVIISIAAGTTLSMVEDMLDADDMPVIRVMPNVNAAVSEAISAVCKNAAATEAHLEYVKGIFGAIGKAVDIDETLFAAYTAIGGCSPAFTFLFIDALANAALKHGIPKAKAVEIAAQAVYGSAKMVLSSPDNPWGLIEKVCSPGGTTIEGVLVLEKEGLSAAVTKAVDATIKKDKKLSKR